MPSCGSCRCGNSGFIKFPPGYPREKQAVNGGSGDQGPISRSTKLSLFISTMAAFSSGEGPLGPGLPRRFGENSCRYLRFTIAAWKARSVEGFNTAVLRSNRPGRMASVHSPAITRSIGRSLGPHPTIVSISIDMTSLGFCTDSCDKAGIRHTHGQLGPAAAAKEFEDGISEHIEAGVRQVARMALDQ